MRQILTSIHRSTGTVAVSIFASFILGLAPTSSIADDAGLQAPSLTQVSRPDMTAIQNAVVVKDPVVVDRITPASENAGKTNARSVDGNGAVATGTPQSN